MTVRRYIGAAAIEAMVTEWTVGGTIEVGDLFKLTIGAKTLTVAATSTVAADVAEEIATAWQSLDSAGWPEFAEVTAQASGAAVRFTANEPGVPFFITGTTTEANGSAADAQTFTETVVTANSGPNDISLADNWSGETVPVTGVDIVIDLDAPSMLWNLDALSSVVAASVRITCGRQTEIGLREHTGAYPEHRQKAFSVQAASWFVETDAGLVNVNTGTATTTAFTVRKTGQRVQEQRAALCITGAKSGNTLNVLRGDVAIQQSAEEVCRWGISVGYVTDQDADATLYCGPGATLDSMVQNGGQVETWSAIASFTQRGGNHVHQSGGITSPKVYAGLLVYNATDALGGNCTVAESGILDFSADPRAKTITNPVELAGNQFWFLDPNNVCNVGGSLVLDLNDSSAIDRIKIGASRRLTLTLPS